MGQNAKKKEKTRRERLFHKTWGPKVKKALEDPKLNARVPQTYFVVHKKGTQGAWPVAVMPGAPTGEYVTLIDENGEHITLKLKFALKPSSTPKVVAAIYGLALNYYETKDANGIAEWAVPVNDLFGDAMTQGGTAPEGYGPPVEHAKLGAPPKMRAPATPKPPVPSLDPNARFKLEEHRVLRVIQVLNEAETVVLEAPHTPEAEVEMLKFVEGLNQNLLAPPANARPDLEEAFAEPAEGPVPPEAEALLEPRAPCGCSAAIVSGNTCLAHGELAEDGFPVGLDRSMKAGDEPHDPTEDHPGIDLSEPEFEDVFGSIAGPSTDFRVRTADFICIQLGEDLFEVLKNRQGLIGSFNKPGFLSVLGACETAVKVMYNRETRVLTFTADEARELGLLTPEHDLRQLILKHRVDDLNHLRYRLDISKASDQESTTLAFWIEDFGHAIERFSYDVQGYMQARALLLALREGRLDQREVVLAWRSSDGHRIASLREDPTEPGVVRVPAETTDTWMREARLHDRRPAGLRFLREGELVDEHYLLHFVASDGSRTQHVRTLGLNRFEVGLDVSSAWIGEVVVKFPGIQIESP